MEEKISATIEQHFDLADPRIDRTKLHKLLDILVIGHLCRHCWSR